MYEGYRSRRISFGVALLSTSAALVLRWPLWPLLGQTSPFLTFFAAVVVTAYLGGFWPGLLATLLGSAASDYFLIEPGGFGVSQTGAIVTLTIFVLIGVSISGLSESLHRTRRKLGDNERRRSDETAERFRQLAENMCEIFWLQENGWERTLYVSPTYEDVWGRTCQSLYDEPRSWVDAVHPDDRDLVSQAIAEQNRGLSTLTEFRIERPDRSIRWVRSRSFSVKDHAGRVNRIAGLAEDITDRKVAEETLRKLKAHLELAMHGSNIALWELDMTQGADGPAKWLNFWEQWGNGTPGDYSTVGAAMSLVHPDDQERLAETIGAYQEVTEFKCTVRALHRDGSYHWVVNQGTTLRDARGKPVGWTGSTIDVNDLKRLEAELLQSHERLKLALRGANVNVWDLELSDGTLSSMRTVHTTGWNHLGSADGDSPSGQREPLGLAHPDDAEVLERALQAHLSGETSEISATYRVRSNGGAYRWMYTRGVAIPAIEGTAIRLVGSDVDITEIKQLETELRLANERLELALRGSNVGVWDIDMPDGDLAHGRQTIINCWELLGFDNTDPRTQQANYFSLLHPADRERAASAQRAYLAGESREYEVEFRALHDDGKHRWLLVRGVAARDSEGTPIRFIGSSIDITDLEERRISEQRYRLLVESTAAIVWTTAATGLQESEQPSWAAFTGASEDQYLGLSWLDSVHPEDRERTAELWSAAVANQSPFAIDFRVRRHDGEYRDLLNRAIPLRNSDGEIYEWFGTCVDVTDRKRADQALRDSEARFRGTFENAAVGIAHIDRQSYCLRANATLADILGYPQPELTGLVLQDLVHPEDLPQNRAQLALLMRGEIPSFADEVRIFRKDGSVVWALVTVSRQPGAEGEPEGRILIVQNISERKRLESELLLAKEAAEAANRAKDEFLANVSHEIRTPMNAILGMTELVLDSHLTEDQRRSLRTVKSGADSLLHTINDLLDFSKIEARKLQLDSDDFSLRTVMVDTLRALATRAHRKSLELVSHVHPDVPDAVVGDAGRLRQVLLNLVGNAIKFTNEGEVLVSVAIADGPAPDGEVCLSFSVRDTGIGIAAEKQDAIFRAFEQADTSTTRKYGGTGLGLTIAARLVALMGGVITVESEPNRGSTFSFTAHFVRQLHPSQAAPPAPAPPLQRLPVLIVDDNATNRHLLEEWLRGWQMEPVSVGDGMAAVDAMWHRAANGRPYALVLLDARMPDTDGMAVAAKIRERVELASTRIILLTSEERPLDIARLRELRIDAYLRKPLEQDELLQTIYHVMSQPKPSPPPMARAAPGEDLGSGPENLGSEPETTTKILDVLVAEDDEMSAAVVEQRLARHGYRVRRASNGREALAMLERKKYDLLLLDVHMPELDGFQVVQSIRAKERDTSTHLPVVALTARSRKGDRERCLAAGMDDFLTKPIGPAELFTTIDRVLGARSPDRLQNLGLIDARTLLAACGSDGALLERMCGQVRVRLPEHLVALRDAFGDKEAERLREIAHRACGSFSEFSAVVGELAGTLEELAASGRLDQAGAVLGELERLGPELLRQVERLSIEVLRGLAITVDAAPTDDT